MTLRVERGGVRHLILDALAEQPRNGYQIILVIQERSEGQYRPSSGIVYPTLHSLEGLGLVKVVENGEHAVYAITATGWRELKAQQAAVQTFYDHARKGVWESQEPDLGDALRRLERLLRVVRHKVAQQQVTDQTAAAIREAIFKIAESLESEP